MKKIIIGFVSTFLLVALDRFTKYLAVVKLMDLPSGFPIIKNVLRLQYLENKGAAFGVLQNKFTFFIIMTVLLMIIFAFLYVKLPSEKRYIPMHVLLIFFISGALGNFIDRIFYHYVVDFIYFELINFPIFNVADIYVSVSCVVFILLICFYYKEEDFKKIKLFSK